MACSGVASIGVAYNMVQFDDPVGIIPHPLARISLQRRSMSTVSNDAYESACRLPRTAAGGDLYQDRDRQRGDRPRPVTVYWLDALNLREVLVQFIIGENAGLFDLSNQQDVIVVANITEDELAIRIDRVEARSDLPADSYVIIRAEADEFGVLIAPEEEGSSSVQICGQEENVPSQLPTDHVPLDVPTALTQPGIVSIDTAREISAFYQGMFWDLDCSASFDENHLKAYLTSKQGHLPVITTNPNQQREIAARLNNVIRNGQASLPSDRAIYPILVKSTDGTVLFRPAEWLLPDGGRDGSSTAIHSSPSPACSARAAELDATPTDVACTQDPSSIPTNDLPRTSARPSGHPEPAVLPGHPAGPPPDSDSDGPANAGQFPATKKGTAPFSPSSPHQENPNLPHRQKASYVGLCGAIMVYEDAQSSYTGLWWAMKKKKKSPHVHIPSVDSSLRGEFVRIIDEAPNHVQANPYNG
ncbi:hypothetical protein B0H19DRAFT_1309444 [Mycena capillaripes]|nr:hypothetical protein B0H19DRAFT_1309444 [Mycena capillaripes]